MKKLGVGVAIGLIFIIFFYGVTKPLIWAPKLVIPETSWDFGKVKTGGMLNHTFIIQNTGRADLTLNVYPNCPRCIHLELEKSSIPPKEEAKLQVKIFTKAEGSYEAYLMLESNDPRNQVKKLTVKGMVVNQ